MKIPCCSVCQTRYNEEERVHLLLQCGHGFCRECLSRMFSASSDATLTCPRCRHVSTVGNSVLTLRKNYAVLSLIQSAVEASAAAGGNRGSNFDCDFTDDDEDGDGEDDDEDDKEKRWRNSRGSQTSSSGSGCAPVIEVGVHQDLKLVKRIAEGRRAGVDMWTAVIGGGQCRHHVAVKKVVITEGMDLDWMLLKLEDLRRASMWCRNVCTFHGAMKVDESLCFVIDKCYGSVQSEMQRNEGRLTLEQVLRFLEFLFCL